MKGYSSIQLIKYLEDRKLVKEISSVYYLTDKLLAIADHVDSPKESLREFCIAIELPFQVVSPTGHKYTIKYVTDRIGKLYVAVLKKVDKEELIEITKKYYKETEYPVTIRNYFEQNVWESALEDFKNDSTMGSSFNKFED